MLIPSKLKKLSQFFLFNTECRMKVKIEIISFSPFVNIDFITLTHFVYNNFFLCTFSFHYLIIMLCESFIYIIYTPARCLKKR